MKHRGACGGLWLEVGVALMYGKQKENREAGQKFSDWVQVMFPGLHQNVAADALWFASSDSIPGMDLPADLTHPHRIRQWFNDHEATLATQAALPADAPEVTVKTIRRTFGSGTVIGSIWVRLNSTSPSTSKAVPKRIIEPS